MTQPLSQQEQALNKFIPPKEKWTPVDYTLFTPESFFHNYKQTQQQLFKAIKHSFHNQYHNNKLYYHLCKAERITPDDIQTVDDYQKIPLIPDNFFKDYPEGSDYIDWLKTIYTGRLPEPNLTKDHPSHDDIIDAMNQQQVSIMFTSGTSGKFSFIPRNARSWNRLKYCAMRSVIDLMDHNYNDDVILLIPDPRQTNLTIASLFGIAFDLYNPSNVHIALEKTQITTQFLRMQRAQAIGIREKIKAKALAQFSPLVQKKSDQRMIKILAEIEKQNKRCNIAGPPFWLNRILNRMQEEGIRFNLPQCQVLTGGGWKAEESKRTPEEAFREKVENLLGIPQDRFHDVYAMSECSSIFLSCEGHYKHIPPVIVPFVLNEELESIGYNEYGRFAFLDPLPDSYPGFIITGDRVKMLEHCPICDREGPVLDIEVSRLPGVEGRGCAAVMAELMQQED